jgi:hypothetical protein
MENFTTPIIANVAMTDANTEYSYALPQGTRSFTFQCRGGNAKISFTSTESGTKYISVASGMSYYEDKVNLDGKTIYFQSPTAACVGEILAWTRVV